MGSHSVAAEPARTRRRHPARRVLGVLGALAVVAALALACALAILPLLVGGKALTVLSGSMEPTLPVGSVAVIRPVEPARLGVGDVVNFTDRDASTGEARVVTHRIVAVQPGPRFVTRGDANPVDDPNPVAAADVHGELWYDVPSVGTVRDRLTAPAGLAILGGVVLLGVALTLLVPRERA
ncbi:signal peptidase I [Pseudonocardia oroxyli]|uniref:Signal peptidase I n=1 Tax=Pseudonocardia oroxyli TaxID=366584 RepID=A0A1G7G3N4_PSEOR|nr:signal peptidase I [Pseudonocardia oroxyli]SDE82754.1 signal peptidase, endoplasmic reticulum-type [Pseudonocardia oroxyli]